MLEAKGFRVTDPFLGHCVAIIATIYLQGSVVDDPGTRKEKQDCFAKCLRFIRGLAVQWPHVGRIVRIIHTEESFLNLTTLKGGQAPRIK
jgi:hypothetical protein